LIYHYSIRENSWQAEQPSGREIWGLYPQALYLAKPEPNTRKGQNLTPGSIKSRLDSQQAILAHPANVYISDLSFIPAGDVRACWGFGFRGKNRQFFDETRRKNGSIAIPK